jgi:hypothetical protein
MWMSRIKDRRTCDTARDADLVLPAGLDDNSSAALSEGVSAGSSGDAGVRPW